MAKARILAVDDQLYFRTFIEGILSDEGYGVRTASSGEEALHALAQERFDVLISDLVMPGMDGSELVQRVKAQIPEQDIIVITGVGDVKTAVGAMKLGATDYLLKPIDRDALARTLNTILQRKRLRDEHSQLVAENLEYMGVLSLYQRAVSLMDTVGIESLAERIVEGLCFETNSQGGVLWIVDAQDPKQFRLCAAQGLVQIQEENEIFSTASLPAELKPLYTDETHGAYTAPLLRASSWTQALFVPLRYGEQVLAVARLTDKFEGAEFSEVDRAAADKFAEIAVLALRNAMRFRDLGTKSLRDPVTGAYSVDYFDDVLQNEIRKAKRFSRSLSVIELEIAPDAMLWKQMSFDQVREWLAGFVQQLARALRTTDLIAAEDQFHYRVLLPETDGLGATVLKRRVREALLESVEMQTLSVENRPEIALATATFPSDGSQAERLHQVLEKRLAEDRESPLRKPIFENAVFAEFVEALQVHAEKMPTGFFEQMMAFLVEEIGRRPQDRGLLLIAPRAGLSPGLLERIEAIERYGSRTEVVLMTEGKLELPAGVQVTRVPAPRSGTSAPFLIFLGEGPAYAYLGSPNKQLLDTVAFHTSERTIVEELAFQLKNVLGISLGV